MKGNVSKGPVLLHYSLLALFPFTKSHKTAESKSKSEIKIQLNIPSNFCVAHFSVILFWLFFFSCHLRSTLSSTLLSMWPAWAWGLVPSVRWPGRCYVRPAWINHVCARLSTSLWIPSRLHLRQAAWGENIPKKENSYKKAINRNASKRFYSFTYL